MAEETKEGYEDHVSEPESSDSVDKTTEDSKLSPERGAGEKVYKFNALNDK